jgi:hypothetical protein
MRGLARSGVDAAGRVTVRQAQLPAASSTTGCVQPASIAFEKSDGSLHPEVAGALSMSSNQLVGMDGQDPCVITNAPFGAGPYPCGRPWRRT